MSDIPSFPYQLLWEERMIRSVANLTRKDGREFLELASRIPVKMETGLFHLQEANEALAALRNGQIQGAAVLVMEGGKPADQFTRSIQHVFLLPSG